MVIVGMSSMSHIVVAGEPTPIADGEQDCEVTGTLRNSREEFPWLRQASLTSYVKTEKPKQQDREANGKRHETIHSVTDKE